VPTVSTSEVLDRFRAALIARDIVPPEPTIADGRLHRCNAAGAHGRGDAAYLQHLDGLPAGGSPYLARKGVKAHGLRVLRELWGRPCPRYRGRVARPAVYRRAWRQALPQGCRACAA